MTTSTRPRTLQGVIAHQARLRPGHQAVVCAGQAVTYAELHRDSDRRRRSCVRPASEAAPGSGISQGVGAVLELAFACAKTGAVLVPVNWRLTAQEVDHILRDSDTEALLVDEEHLPVVAEVRAGLPTLHTVLRVDAPADDPDGLMARKAAVGDDTIDAAGDDDESPVVQIYTSGTSGLPKGVVLPHRSFFDVAEAMDAQRTGLVRLEARRPEPDADAGLPHRRAVVRDAGVQRGRHRGVPARLRQLRRGAGDRGGRGSPPPAWPRRCCK